MSDANSGRKAGSNRHVERQNLSESNSDHTIQKAIDESSKRNKALKFIRPVNNRNKEALYLCPYPHGLFLESIRRPSGPGSHEVGQAPPGPYEYQHLRYLWPHVHHHFPIMFQAGPCHKLHQWRCCHVAPSILYQEGSRSRIELKALPDIQIVA